MEKVFLFEIASKLYIATDTSPVELTNFSICSEMVYFFIFFFNNSLKLLKYFKDLS